MKIDQTKLKNGIRLISSDIPDANSITVFVLIGSGMVHEHIPGLAHFVEHTVFKGTERRQSALEINNEIEGVGGYMNAATSQDYTEYYIKIPHEFYEKAFDILSDIIFNSKFEESEIEKEKGVVIEEINMYEDMPIRSVSDSFYSLVWNNSPLGRPILGTIDNVKSIKREDIIQFIDSNYIPENIIISVAGNLQGKDVPSICEKYFGISKEKKEYSEKTPIFKLNEKNSFNIKRENLIARWEKRGVKQTHFCLGVKALSYLDERSYSLDVGAGLLAEGSGSILWQKVREELGASYYLDSQIELFKDSGLWYIHSGVDNDKFYDVLEIIVKAIRDLKINNINDKFLERTKAYLKGDFVMNLDTTEEIARYISHELLEQGKIKTIEEEKESIDRVNGNQISKLFNDLFEDKVYLNVLSKDIDLDKASAIISTVLY